MVLPLYFRQIKTRKRPSKGTNSGSECRLLSAQFKSAIATRCISRTAFLRLKIVYCAMSSRMTGKGGFAKPLVVIDEALALSEPGLARQIENYFAAYSDTLKLVCPSRHP